MTPESLLGGTQDVLWGCHTCATRDTTEKKSDEPPRCRVCGGEMVRMDRTRKRAVRKGLSPLQRIASDLNDATEEDVTMSTVLERATDTLVKSTLGKLIGVLGKAADLDEEELEDLEDEMEDVEEVVDDADGALEDVDDEFADLGEEDLEDLDDEPPLGVEDEDDEAPGEEDADEIIAALEDAEDAVPDLGDEYVEEDEDEDEEDEYMAKGMMKSVQEALAAAEGGEEVLAVLDAEGLLEGTIGPFAKAVEARLDAQDEAIARQLEATAALGEALGPYLEDMRKSVEGAQERVEEVEQAEDERRKALGARPAGTKIRKSPNEGDGEASPAALGERITKALHDEKINVGDAGKMRVLARKGEYEEVAAGLERAGA